MNANPQDQPGETSANPVTDGPTAAVASKKRVPAVEGLFTMDENAPHLIGGRGLSRQSYFFPKDLAGNDPRCAADSSTEEVLLSRRGVIWSYTTASYPPPPPYVITRDPWVPLVLAAVQLPEKIVVLGPMTDDVALEDMRIGMEVELTLDTLYEDAENEYVSWKWKPVV